MPLFPLARPGALPAAPLPAPLVLAAALALAPLAAGAQELAAPPADPAATAPFAFAAAGAKAERAAAAAEAAAGSGSRVIGGEVAAPGAWPWQVGFLVAGQPVTPDAHFCGGSMVLDRWVLTAAHCVHMADASGTFADLPPQAFNVLVGSNRLAEGEGEIVPVEAVFVHPGYVGTAFDNDIALVRLARTPTAPFQTIKVPDPEFADILEQPGVPTIVTGWGVIEGGEHPEDMRQAEIQMLPRDACNGALLEAKAQVAAQGLSQAITAFNLGEEDAEAIWTDMVSRVRPPLSENMVCSGTYEGGRTACSGDSGGPLVVPLDGGQFIQAGVVSWGLSAEGGRGCFEQAKFSAYTRTGNYVDWLNGVVSANP